MERIINPRKTWTREEYREARLKLGLDSPFRSFSIRSREDFENAMLVLDTIRANFAARFAKGEPVDKMGIDQKLDEGERIFKGKLLAIRMRMLDAEIERKNTIEVRHTDEGLERKAAGQWKSTTEAEVGRLATQDSKNIRVKRGTFRANTED